jgi:HAE1 family hydrophobic/amphiphilic exporter-1
MSSLPEMSVKRPVTTIMAYVALVTIGVIALLRLSIDLLPQIDFPSISVMTTYEGVGPEEMETLITRPIEEAVSTVQGLDRLESFSAEGRSRVQLRFTWGTSLDGALNDVRAAIERIRDTLPEDAETPVVFKFDLSSFPIMFLTLAGSIEPWKLRQLADDKLKYRLERVEGVAAVDIRGGIRREIHVDLSTQKLSSFGLTGEQVAAALKRDNINLAAGDVRDKGYEVIVRTVGEFRNLAQIGDTIVTERGGSPVRVRDVAAVSDSYEEPINSVLVNGKPGIRLAVSKLPLANTVAVSNRVSREIEQINREMPGIRVAKRFDTADFIKSSISNIEQGLLIGGILAVIVLLLFLRKAYPTVITSMAIPIAVIGTFAFMYLGGFTLNMITFGGLAIGLGMLVDNSIVILENIQRHREGGETSMVAAVRGSGEVAVAISASTLTTVCVFVPVIFIKGMAGILFGQLAWVVTFALACSLMVALTLVPVMASMGGGSLAGEKPKWRITAFLAGFEKKMISGYGRLIGGALGRRKTVYAVAIGLLALSIGLARFVGVELMPETDQGEISIDGELPVGTPLEKTEVVARKLVGLVSREVPEREAVMSVAGPSGSWSEAGANGIRMRIKLKEPSERSSSTEKIAGVLRPFLAGVPGLKTKVRLNEGFFIFRILRGTGERISVELRGYDLDTAFKTAKKVSAMVEAVPGVTDVDIDMKEGNREAAIYIDASKAADLGLAVGDIGQTVSTYVLGTGATYYRDKGDEFRVLVRLGEKDRRSESQLEGLPLITPAGKRVSLGDVASVVRGYAPMSIRRLNQERIVTVSAGFAGRDLGSIIGDIRDRLAGMSVPEGFTVGMGGEYEEQQKTFFQLLIGLILAIALVYMVMASLYESFLHPFVMLLAIPFSTIGVVTTLLLTGTTLNIYSFLGTIVLMGVVVNNAIVMVDHINLLRREYGFGLTEAVMEGARRRLRPILMTTLTTTLALTPVAIGMGEGSEMQTPLARVLVGGLLSASLITLIFIPCLYVTLETLKARRSRAA